eukprot:16428055-Heterocapsa_arctica.AAC.1
MSCVIRSHFGFVACRGARRSRGQAYVRRGELALARPACRAHYGAADARAFRYATQKLPDRQQQQ